MQAHADKNQENKDKAVANTVSQKKSDIKSAFRFVDNRSEFIAQRKLQEAANNSPRAKQMKASQQMANNSPQVKIESRHDGVVQRALNESIKEDTIVIISNSEHEFYNRIGYIINSQKINGKITIALSNDQGNKIEKLIDPNDLDDYPDNKKQQENDFMAELMDMDANFLSEYKGLMNQHKLNVVEFFPHEKKFNIFKSLPEMREIYYSKNNNARLNRGIREKVGEILIKNEIKTKETYSGTKWGEVTKSDPFKEYLENCKKLEDSSLSIEYSTSNEEFQESKETFEKQIRDMRLKSNELKELVDQYQPVDGPWPWAEEALSDIYKNDALDLWAIEKVIKNGYTQ